MALFAFCLLYLAVLGSAYPQQYTNATSSTSATPTSCAEGFKNVVFNGDGSAPAQSSIDAISGATNWITFGPGNATKEIPMMAFATDVPTAVNLVQSTPAPDYLLTFNEPDYSYAGSTATMSPQQAASAIQPLLNAVTNSTKLIAPAVADSTSDWLPQFYAACNCQNRFYAYNLHVYRPSIADAQSVITTFRSKYGDRPLWITEIAPGGANPACSLSWQQVQGFMSTLFSWGRQQGWIERIFWNSGNQITNGDTNVCNSYLLDSGGSPSPLLSFFNSVGC